ncbi:MAG: hypothetical protein ACYC02_03695 [Thiobacillus sp.]
MATHASVSAFRLSAPLPVFHHELTLNVSSMSGAFLGVEWAVSGKAETVPSAPGWPGMALAEFSILRSLGRADASITGSASRGVILNDPSALGHALLDRCGIRRFCPAGFFCDFQIARVRPALVGQLAASAEQQGEKQQAAAAAMNRGWGGICRHVHGPFRVCHPAQKL